MRIVIGGFDCPGTRLELYIVPVPGIFWLARDSSENVRDAHELYFEGSQTRRSVEKGN